MKAEIENLGIRIGLEIHQQLDTKKLFCACPSTIRDDEADIVVTRKLRAAAGETGETDIAAEYEMSRERHYIYNAYSNTTCMVELDEEPIHDINREALKAALQLAGMTKSRIADKILVMRKTVVDGSNTSGFQRTALVARNGKIDTDSGIIGIPTICIEEESAKIVKATPEFVIYNLSRLGIPLIEISTEPEIKTPEQVKEVAEHIGMLLRSTGKVKRGLGTIRQDLNVSIKGGARVEIKGAQELKLLPKLAEIEALRQKGLIEISEELKKRKAEVDENIVDMTAVLSESNSELIKNNLSNKGRILAIKLKGFKGLIGKEIVIGRRLGKELSEHAKNAAGVGGAIHIDELPRYGITEKDVEAIKNKLGCKEHDGFIFVADEKEKAEKAIKAIIKRAKQAIEGVNSEVRKANPDGTSSYLRPMPGSSRMYPETDIKPISPEAKGIEMPELLKQKAEKYEKLGVSKDLAQQMSKSRFSGEFEKLTSKHKNIEPLFIATTILNAPKEIRKRYNLNSELTMSEIELLFENINSKKITKEAVFEIILENAKGMPLKEAISKYILLTDKELEEKIGRIILENKGIPFNALIGKAMELLRGKAEGKKIVEIVKKLSK